MAKQTFTIGQVLTAAQMTSLQQTAMGGGSVTAKTASYTLVAADAGTVVQMNSASATTITVNTALFAAGDSVQIQNVGAGVCTITAGTATVNTAGSLALSQYEGGQLYFNTTSAALFFDTVQAGGASDISCRVYQTTTTNLSTTFAAIAFGAENFDTDTMHDNSTNNSRITIKTAGKFSVGGQASTTTNAALGVRILLNGTTVISRVFQGNSASTEGANVSTIYDFAINDYIELQAALASGTGTTSGDGTLQNFWAVKL